MSRPRWMLIVTIVIGLTAFVIGPHIWPMASDVPLPPVNLLPGYIVLSATEALAFGFAAAFALFGWPAIRGLGLGAAWLNKWLFVTLCWFMGNWWMHDSLHMHNGMNMPFTTTLSLGKDSCDSRRNSATLTTLSRGSRREFHPGHQVGAASQCASS